MASVRINIGHDGTPAREYRTSDTTANGRWQVVTGSGDDLLGLPARSIFIRDLTTNVIEAGAFTLTGELVEDAIEGRISADGRYVVYTSAQDNIVAGDTNGVADVFRYDRVTKTTELVSRDVDGGFADGASRWAMISADGRYVAFLSKATDLAGGPATSAYDNAYIRDMATGQTQRLTFTIDASGRGGIANDVQVGHTPISITATGGVTFEVLQYYDWGTEYTPKTVSTAAFGGTISVLDAQTHYNRAGTEWLSYSGQNSLTLKAFLPGDDPEKIPTLTWSKGGFGFYSWIDFAENGRFAVMATRFDPGTGADVPGIYLWDMHDRSQTKVGTFRLLATLPSYDQIQELRISADGGLITYVLKDLTPIIDPETGWPVPPSAWVDGSFSVANPVGTHGGGVVEIAKPEQWRITEGNDAAVGTSIGDEIHLRGGHDRAWGAAGDDRIWGDGGDDTLYGNIGKDTLYGGAGDDTLDGGEHDDTLYGGSDDDTLYGGGGNDTLYGEGDNDLLFGDEGIDHLYGGAGDDVLWGGAGDDVLEGGAGNDVLHGGAGNETFYGEAGDDVIDGGTDDDRQDIDVLRLSGSAADHNLKDEEREVGGTIEKVTTTRSDAHGFDIVMNIEQARFDHLRTNAVSGEENVYLTLAKAANFAYTADRFVDGWAPLTALELGIARSGVINDAESVTHWTFANGFYSAKGPGRINGAEIEAAAQVSFAVVDGKTTLMLAIRGTDDLTADGQDYPQFQWHYDRFKPLIDAIIDYVAHGGYADGGRIDQIWVSGHSLGGATVQQLMQDPRIFGDDRFLAATFGAPGSESHQYDSRLLHFEHSADIVPIAGDQARLAHGNLAPIYRFYGLEDGKWLDAFMEANPDPTEFYSAGKSVRISTHEGITLHPLEQHSMDNYVQSLEMMARNPSWFPFLTQGTAAIPGQAARVALGTDAADELVGASADYINYFRSNEYWDGSERLFGGGGRDSIRGGAGRDSFEGTLTQLNGDTIHDLAGGEYIRVWGGRPIAQAEVGYSYDAETDRGTLNIAGAEIILEGRHVGDFRVSQHNGYVEIQFVGNSWLGGTDGDDELAGGDGNDVLRGRRGTDIIRGGDGDDRLIGDDDGDAGLRSFGAAGGDDWLDGGLGSDTLTGGGGRDTFVIGTDAADTITDFEAGWGGDILEVSALVRSLGIEEDPFIGGYLRLVDNGQGGTHLILDPDGRAGAAAGMIVAILNGVKPTDLFAENFTAHVPVDPSHGLPTITGSGERDHLVGGDEAERIVGHGGSDVIHGGGGNDMILVDGPAWGSWGGGGEGPVGEIPAEFADHDRDVAFGGDGDDTMINYGLFAEMFGGEGNDFLTGSYGHHWLHGEAGDDIFLLQSGGYYRLWGGAGSDTYIYRGANAASILDFDVAEDRIDLRGSGIASFEQLDLSASNGWLHLGSLSLKDVRIGDLTAANFIFDRIHERDVVRAGGTGTVASPRPDLVKNELFRVDAGTVTEVSGGLGNDRFYFGDAFHSAIRIDGGPGRDEILLRGLYTGDRAVRLDLEAVIRIEEVTLLSGTDTRYGAATGATGYHVVFGADGAPATFFTIDGGMLAAGETLTFDSTAAPSAYDRLRVTGGDADDEMRGGIGIEEFFGGAGNDRLHGGGGRDYLAGGDGDDRLDGGEGDDTLYGEFGRDVLTGGDGDDYLEGGVGDEETIDDILSGGRGSDTLVASSGAILTGGEGRDTFRFGTFVKDVTITDFAGDLLDLTGLVHHLAGTNDVDAIRAGLVRFVERDGSLLVQANRDGWVTVATLEGIALASLAAGDVIGVSLPGKVEAGGDDGNVFHGGAGADTFTGGSGTDLFWLQDGGIDHAFGGAGDDGFFFGAALDPFDVIDGGPGGQDQLALRGDYSGQLLLGERNLVNIETMVLLSGSDTRLGGSATDRFSYNLKSIDANVAAGQTLTVTMNMLRPDESVVFDGSWETDGSFRFFGGLGRDVLTGGAQADGFYFGDGGRFGPDDRVDGGGGNDELALQGNYTTVFGANQIIGIETIVLLSGGDGRFGGGGTAYGYDLTLHDDTVRSGRLTITGNALGANERMRVDGSAERESGLTIYGGKGHDTLIGGAGADILYGGEGIDVLTGGAGADIFLYLGASHSTGAAHDRITDFSFAEDRIDLVGTTADYHRAADTRIAGATSGTLDTRLAEALSGVLGVKGVAIVHADGGTFAGRVFLVVDQNGEAGYQAGADLVIDLGFATDAPATGLGFIL